MTANEIANKHTGFFGRMFGKKEALMKDIIEFGNQNRVATPSSEGVNDEMLAIGAMRQAEYCVKTYIDHADTVKNKDVMVSLLSTLVSFEGRP